MDAKKLTKLSLKKAAEVYQQPYPQALWSLGYCDAWNGSERTVRHYNEKVIYDQGYDQGLIDKEKG